MKRLIGKTLFHLGNAWLAVAGTVILIGYGMVWYTSGFMALTAMLSPFNIANFLAVLITLAPGLVARHFGEKLR